MEILPYIEGFPLGGWHSMLTIRISVINILRNIFSFVFLCLHCLLISVILKNKVFISFGLK